MRGEKGVRQNFCPFNPGTNAPQNPQMSPPPHKRKNNKQLTTCKGCQPPVGTRPANPPPPTPKKRPPRDSHWMSEGVDLRVIHSTYFYTLEIRIYPSQVAGFEAEARSPRDWKMLGRAPISGG